MMKIQKINNQANNQKIKVQKINGKYIKLDQLLKLAGIAETGGQAKMIIQSCQVKVNNQICFERGKKLYDQDIVLYSDVAIKIEAGFDDTSSNNKLKDT